MSIYLTDAAIQEFDTEVKHQAQAVERLMGAVAIRRVKGESYNFRRMGRGMAQQKASQADVTPLNLTHKKILCVLQNWHAADYTDIFDEAEVNFDEKIELAKALAKAMERRKDQLSLNAMAACSFDADTHTGDPDKALNFDYSATGNFDNVCIHKVLAHLQDLEACEDVHAAVKPAAIQSLLQTVRTGSQDYNSIKPLIEGDLTTKWMGITWHKLGLRDEGGVVVAGANDHYAYFWVKEAIGMAVGIEQRTEINYIPVKTSTLTNVIFKAGAVVREPQLIVRIQYDPARAPVA